MILSIQNRWKKLAYELLDMWQYLLA